METSHVERGSETSPDSRAAAMRKMTGIFKGLFPKQAGAVAWGLSCFFCSRNIVFTVCLLCVRYRGLFFLKLMVSYFSNEKSRFWSKTVTPIRVCAQYFMWQHKSHQFLNKKTQEDPTQWKGVNFIKIMPQQMSQVSTNQSNGNPNHKCDPKIRIWNRNLRICFIS